MIKVKFILICVGTVLMNGCASVPASLKTQNLNNITPTTAQTHPEVLGEKVRWGGILIKTSPNKTRTCFEVTSMPLDDIARPVRGDQTNGRFIACANGFYDPSIYKANRDITFIGTLEVPVIKPINNYSYIFPKLNAQIVYLWPKEAPVMYDWNPNGYGGDGGFEGDSMMGYPMMGDPMGPMFDPD